MKKRTPPPQDSGHATAALVLGIVSLVFGWIPVLGWAVSITAIVMGAVALRHGAQGRSRTYAIVGIAFGALPLVVWVLLIAVIVALAASGVSLLTAGFPLIPDMCALDGPVTCVGVAAQGSGTQLTLLNNGREDISSAIVTLGAECSPQEGTGGAWPAGGQRVFTCDVRPPLHHVLTVRYERQNETRYGEVSGYVRVAK